MIEEHEDALRADLLRVGLRLSWLWTSEDDRLTWRDLAALIAQWLRRDPGSYLARALLGEDWPWDIHAQLLATVIDATQAQTWALAGGTKENRPEPFPRPGVESTAKDILTAEAVGDIRGGGLDKDAIIDPREWLGW